MNRIHVPGICICCRSFPNLGIDDCMLINANPHPEDPMLLITFVSPIGEAMGFPTWHIYQSIYVCFTETWQIVSWELDDSEGEWEPFDD